MLGFLKTYMKPYLKAIWVWMLEPPWRHSGTSGWNNLHRDLHWVIWLFGWAWAIAGLVLGAVVAPLLVQSVGLANTPYQDAVDIGIATVAGFLAQLLGWLLFLLGFLMVTRASLSAYRLPRIGTLMGGTAIGCLLFPAGLFVVVLVPLAATGYALYRYFTWVGTGQARVTTAFVGALLVKTFLIPLIKGIVTGSIMAGIMKWLRGGKSAKP